jgi:UDP-N-acetylmuramyl pentapeptide phosphotransferase/UDP-N-acetylglucosamine-1-phosphate transferase
MIYQEFITVIFFTIINCYLLISLAKKFALLDYPTERKKHKFPTPYVGGLVIGIQCIIISEFYSPENFQLQTLLLCSFLMSIIGLIDDKFELNVVNKANYNDGINGNLISIFIIFLLIIINFIDENNVIYKIILFLIPINIVLFIFNCLVRKELTLFLGDSGSLTIGFLISFICIYCALNDIIYYALIPWIINYLVFEFISTNISRIIKKKKLFNAGDDHLHYLLEKIFVKNYFIILIINSIYIFNFLIGFLIFKFLGATASIMSFVIYFFIYFYLREKLFHKFKL